MNLRWRRDLTILQIEQGLQETSVVSYIASGIWLCDSVCTSTESHITAIPCTPAHECHYPWIKIPQWMQVCIPGNTKNTTQMSRAHWWCCTYSPPNPNPPALLPVATSQPPQALLQQCLPWSQTNICVALEWGEQVVGLRPIINGRWQMSSSWFACKHFCTGSTRDYFVSPQTMHCHFRHSQTLSKV